jgi:anti-sigma factor RsiW
MPCAETLRTQAFIDGEVVGPEAEAIERHIEGCADCQAFCAAAAALSDAVRTRAPRHAAPASLWRRVEAMLDKEEARLAHPLRSFNPRRAAFWGGAFGGAGVTAMAASLAALMLLPPSAVTLADQVTAAHTRALIEGREIEVASTDHHTVKPWFAGRLPLSPPVADFAAQGYRLIGGRIDKVAGAPAAVVVYRHGKHEIDLFVWADRRSPLPSAGLSHGYHSIFWKNHDLDFAAVSDTAAPELASFVTLVRGEGE